MVTVNEVFRDFTIDGVPSSGAYKPPKHLIRELLSAIATGSSDGIYDFIPASNVGAGSANAIEASTAVNLPGAPNGALIAVNVFTENTGSTTIRFNGAGTTYTVKNVDGSNLQAGDLLSGMVVAGYISGSTFRLISDVSSLNNREAAEAAAAAAGASEAAAETAQAQAEDARDIAAGYASDAVSQGNVPIYATLLGMSELTIPPGINYVRTNGYAAAGDGGGAHYVETDETIYNATPDRLRFTSANGRMFVINEPVIDVRMAGVVLDGETDVTEAYQAALDRNLPVHHPVGDALITDKLTAKNGQHWYGEDRTKSRLIVSSGFNLATTTVVQLGTGEPGASFFDIGIDFQQISTNVRANLIQFPPAIDFSDVPRVQIDRIRISKAFDGIKATGNAGGAYLGRIEVGAFNVGLDIDGALDFFHGDSWHFWPYSHAGDADLMSVYTDGETIALRSGKCDGFSASKVSTFQGKVVINGTEPSVLTMHIGSLQLDGDKARLVMSGRTLQLGMAYTTKNAPIGPSIDVSGGRLILGQIHLLEVPGGGVSVSGGEVYINGGMLSVGSSAGIAAEVTGGELNLHGVHLVPGPVARTAGFVRQVGASGTLRVKGCTASLNGASGPIVAVETDRATIDISGNNFGNWSVAAAANARLGCYGPNETVAAVFLPRVTFATPGDWSPTYNLQQGRWWREHNGFRFVIRLLFDANSYTTAAGNLQIMDLPLTISGAIDLAALDLAAFSKLTLDAGYTHVSASASLADNAIRLFQSGNAVSAQTLQADAIPPGTTGVELRISGFIPT